MLVQQAEGLAAGQAAVAWGGMGGKLAIVIAGNLLGR
jgi:hypothetical protein